MISLSIAANITYYTRMSLGVSEQIYAFDIVHFIEEIYSDVE